MQLGTEHGGFIAFIDAVLYLDLVLNGDVIVGRDELEAVAVGDTGLQELFHHVVAHKGLFSRGGEVAAQTDIGLHVSRGVDELVDIPRGAFQEDEMAENAMGIGLFFLFIETSAEELIGIEGTYEGFVVAKALGIGIVEPLAELVHFEVCHDMPLGNGVIGRCNGMYIIGDRRVHVRQGLVLASLFCAD